MVTMDAVTAIVNDHRLLEDLSAQLRTDTADRAALLTEVRARLLAHHRAEQKLLFPAVRAKSGTAGETGAADLSVAEERLAAVAPAAGGMPGGVLEELAQAVRQHASTIESEVLPRLNDLLSTRKREELGRRFDGLRQRELKRSGIDDTLTKEDLYIRAQQAGISGRSSMSKGELARALLMARNPAKKN
jgi:hypothetical protein